MTRTIATAASLSAVLIMGCAGEKPAPTPAPVATVAPQATIAPPTTVMVAPAAPAEFGVPECDRYVQKFMACLEKVPEATRGMVRQGFDQSREQWRRVAATPEGRAGLAAGCTQAEAAAKMTMQAYGCQW